MDTSPPPSVSSSDAARERAVEDVEAFLRELVAGLDPEPIRAGPGRPRVLPALALWAGLLVCVLRGFSGQLDLWRLLAARGLWDYPRFPVGDQAVYKRLAAGGTAELEALFARASAALAERLEPYAEATLAPFAAEVVALDHIRLDQVARRLPALRGAPPGDPRLLAGQLAGLFDLRRQQWRRALCIADPHQNEKRPKGARARELVSSLPVGSLVLCDLGFFGFAWFDDLAAGGYLYVSRLRAGTTYRVLHASYHRGDTFDGLVWLGEHRADRARRAVRLVQFRAGGAVHRYITNVTDPARLPLAEVARLYARRWDFDLAANLAKRHLGLHLLWSAKEVVVRQQVWAVLIVGQILQALRLEIAGRAGADPFEVSMALLVRWLPRLAADGRDPIEAFLEHGRRVRFIRPSSRTTIRAPTISESELIPPPPGLALERAARHARRNCGPRPAKRSANRPAKEAK